MDRFLVISSDGHAGPRPEVDRDYLDPQYRDEFPLAERIGPECASFRDEAA